MNLSEPTQFSLKQVQQRYDLAVHLAQQAGALLIQARQQGSFKRNYKDHQELVTSTDQEVDDFLCAQLNQAFPEDIILSEENITSIDKAENLPGLWILDPIDGTVNFAHGQSHVAVSIGFYSYGQPLIGVVFAPFLQETFTAIRGQGACLNGKPIQVSGLASLRPALIATGFPYDKSQLEPLIRRLGRVLPQCQDVRRCGSAALDICHVAAGSLDGYYESLSLWDFAAAVLIAQEAGAELSHLYPNPKLPFYLDDQNWVITTPAIHAQLTQLLLQADQMPPQAAVLT